MNKIKKRLAAVMAAGAIATAGLIAPQAMAAESTEMELRILQMEESLRMMRGELEAVRSGRNESGRFDALEERMGAVETADMPFGRVFFRSGFQNNNESRTNDILVDAGEAQEAGVNVPANAGNPQGWYFGAGIEHGLSRDLFGLMDDTHFMGEITINYSDKGKTMLKNMPLPTVANDSYQGASSAVNSALCGGNQTYGDCQGYVAVTQIKISASPKIRFAGLASSLPMGIEPWLIPGGFTLNVISPPSNGVTVTAPGVQFGAGFDLPLLKNITFGFEGIYNMVSDSQLTTTKISGYELGGALGFKF